ncbi:hypothetical protein [Sphingosinicella sp. CPCC 101087]|uniref:hypothetical protein n=1 Tax=Sphingosinicella sp. CPCC 101087 TaxID=2497754 RepID=UPI00101BE879|nr:hypothetical protein [Sphingosinicella sp. CPCC 101087]
MSNEAAAALTAGTRAVGSDDLAQGLLLVQASAIKVVRLQLAMERRDRRTALEAVDELMRLDRRISDFLDDLPINGEKVSAAREEVEAQGRALAREKFALAAGMAGPRLSTGRAPWVEPAAPLAVPAAEAPVRGPLGEVAEPQDDRGAAPAPTRRDRYAGSSRWMAALLTIVLLALAGCAFLYFSAAGQDLLGRLPPIDLPAIDGGWR